MNQRFEEYVDAATRGVVGLSRQDREQHAEEMRQHLEALARQHEYAGSTQAEAVQAALAAFGPATRVRYGLQRTYLRRMVGVFRVWWFSIDSVPVGFLVVLLTLALATVPLQMLTRWLEPALDILSPYLYCILGPALYTIALFVGGWLAGWTAPRRGFWGVLLVTAFYIYRCALEFPAIARNINHPKLFWLPFLTTMFCLIAIPMALLWGVRTASRKRKTA